MQSRMSNLTIDIEYVKQQLNHAVEQSVVVMPPTLYESFASSTLSVLFQQYHAILDAAKDKLKRRTSWPITLRFFPFNFRLSQKLGLMIYERLLREQKFASQKITQATQVLTHTFTIGSQFQLGKISDLENEVSALREQLEMLRQEIAVLNNKPRNDKIS